MFSPRVLRSVLGSLDLEVLRAQRIMGFFILTTHKSTRSGILITWHNSGQKLFEIHCAASVTLNRFLPSRPSYDFISLHRTSALPLSILLVEGAGGICMYHSNSINRDCSVTDFISLTKPMNARHESVNIG